MAFKLSLGCRYGYSYRYGYGYGYGYGKRTCCKDCNVAKCEKCQCQWFSESDPTTRGVYPGQTVGPYCKAHRKKYTYRADSTTESSFITGCEFYSDGYTTSINLNNFSFSVDVPSKKVSTDLSGGSVCIDQCTIGTEIPIPAHTITRSVPWRNHPLGPVLGTFVIVFDVEPVVKCYPANTAMEGGTPTQPTLGIEWNCSGYSTSGSMPPCGGQILPTMNAEAIKNAMNARPSMLTKYTTVETRGFPADEQCCCFSYSDNPITKQKARYCRLPDFLRLSGTGGSVTIVNANPFAPPATINYAINPFDGEFIIDQASMSNCTFDLRNLINLPVFSGYPHGSLDQFQLTLASGGGSGSDFFLIAGAQIIVRVTTINPFSVSSFTYNYRKNFQGFDYCPTDTHELPLISSAAGVSANQVTMTHTFTPPKIELIFPPIP